MKFKLYLLTIDRDDCNDSYIFTSQKAREERQLELMRKFLSRRRSNDELADLGTSLEEYDVEIANDPDAAENAFDNAWSEFCEHEGDCGNYYDLLAPEIELPPEYDVLLEAAKESADWLLECNMGTEQQERGVKLWAAIKALSPRQS